MPIDWKSPEAYQRLLAAIVAAQDGMKVCLLLYYVPKHLACSFDAGLDKVFFNVKEESLR